MSDLMTFPDSVEEFMNQYKVVDTEQVYTNGAELVPIFRMKQWFEHLPSAQPENIRCRDCKNWDKTWTNDWSPEYHYCSMIDGSSKGDFYCADAERGTEDE